MLLKENLKNKTIKISYQSLTTEVSEDTGLFKDSNEEFIIIELLNKKLKYIPISRIIRIAEQ